jgi:hypothetical protein
MVDIAVNNKKLLLFIYLFIYLLQFLKIILLSRTRKLHRTIHGEKRQTWIELIWCLSVQSSTSSFLFLLAKFHEKEKFKKSNDFLVF